MARIAPTECLHDFNIFMKLWWGSSVEIMIYNSLSDIILVLSDVIFKLPGNYMNSFELHDLFHWSVQEGHATIINSEPKEEICSML